MLHIISELNNDLTELEANVKPTWGGLIEPLERIADRIARSWGTVSHLKVSYHSWLEAAAAQNNLQLASLLRMNHSCCVR